MTKITATRPVPLGPYPAAVRAWKPGARAAIRWPGTICRFVCTRYRRANGANSKAAHPPNTLKPYLDILRALYIVFAVPPSHRNAGRAILQTPKVYLFDT